MLVKPREGEFRVNLVDALRGSADARGSELSRHRFLPTRTGIIELVILFAALAVIDRLIMTPGDFAKLQPHPYWLPVILLSLQYGTADGMLAATVAILLDLALGWPSQGVAEDYYRYVVRVWAVPICWILTAIVIGEVRARQRTRIIELTGALDETRRQAADITGHCYKLDEKIQRLEREFATAEAFSLDALAAALRDLHHGDAGAWTESLGRVHRGLIGCGNLSLFVRTDRAYVQVAHVSASPEHEPAAVVSPRDGGRGSLSALLETVVAGQQALNALNRDDAASLDGVAAMAIPLTGAPLFTSEASGADAKAFEASAFEARQPLLGALLLDGLPVERLTIDTQNRLELLQREVVQALTARGVDDLIDAAGPSAHIDLGRADPHATAPSAGGSQGRRLGIFPRFGRA